MDIVKAKINDSLLELLKRERVGGESPLMRNNVAGNYTVRVKPNAKPERVEEKNGILKIWTKEPAKEGKANEAARKLLAEYFKVTKRQVEIKSGFKSKQKVVQVKNRIK